MIGSPLTLFKENPLRRYSNCVQLYSSRALTKLGDKLIAFAGIGTILAEPLSASLLYRLLDTHFDWALLWEQSTPGKRNDESGYTREGFFPS